MHFSGILLFKGIYRTIAQDKLPEKPSLVLIKKPKIKVFEVLEKYALHKVCLLSGNYHCFAGHTVVPGFSVLGFSVLPGFRALNAGDGAWSVHKTLFGFSAPLFQHLIYI